MVSHTSGPPVESPWPVGLPSLFQRTDAARVVSVGKVAEVAVPANWLTLSGGAVNLVMRGPMPPDGLFTSVVCCMLVAPRPMSHVSLTLMRRKSSGWFSGSRAGAAADTGACGVQTSTGGVAATLSFGSSNVQTLVSTVYSMPRRLTFHGEPSVPTLASSAGFICASVRTS